VAVAPPDPPPVPALPPVPTLPPVPDVPLDDEQAPIENPPTTNAPATNHDALFIWFPFFDKSNNYVSPKSLCTTKLRAPRLTTAQ
jgi:hypothetical protein